MRKFNPYLVGVHWKPSEYDIKSSYSVSLNLSLNINCAEVDICERSEFMPVSCYKRVIHTETKITFMQFPNKGVR
jgi:hypothetical protein